MARPMVSCVVLTNAPQRAAMLADALLSYQLQTYPNRELVVVNDGVPLAPVRDGVFVVNLAPGMTLGEKRSFALTVCRGAYVTTWDDDDFSFPERLALEMAEVQRTGVGYVRTSRVWLAGSDLEIVARIHNEAFNTALVWRRLALEAGGFPPWNYGEDGALFAKLLALSQPLGRLNDPFYVHRRHGGNVTLRDKAHTLARYLSADDGATPGELAAVNARLRALLATPRTSYLRRLTARP